ncbi:MAG TPA: MlaD family protein, partial [Nitrospinota bacterium]|nr:MlaD family protein [Nitrospinota bacterium]
LGAGMLFREELIVETYIDGSVQGLDVGAPVKFRGVKVGEVKEITLVRMAYKIRQTAYPYVVIRFTIDWALIGVEKEEREEFVTRLKVATEEVGFRVRLASQGLTGVAYLEADFLDPERFPPLEFDWEPKYPVIPSAPSTLTAIKESIDKISISLEKVNFEELADEVKGTLNAIEEKVEDIDTKGISDEAVGLLAEVRKTNKRFKKILDKPEIDDTLSDLKETMANANVLTGSLSNKLPETVAEIRKAIRRIDNMISSQQYDIEVMIENLRLISSNIRELTENIKRYPSEIIFGKPPAPSKTGGGE